MYNLHQFYILNLREYGNYIDRKIVINHVNNLDTAALMYLMNFKNKT